VHEAGTDKVVRISINERIAIKSVGSIGRAAKVCAGGRMKVLPETQYFFTTSIGRGLFFILHYAYNVCGLYFRSLVGFGNTRYK
ncbi:hypothetical protein IKF86_01285, partial [Candidatus Saccharibacteria bacterium]|nr:hypothetical protein [Candidatus Saccharibacteria bacterium]